MNLSYMMAGKTSNFIEIVSSSSPSRYSEYSLSINKSVILDESSPPSSANKCERGPITPRKLMLTPMGKGQLDIMSLFAKKPINIEVASSEEKTKGKEIMEKKCEDITKEINQIKEYVQEQIEKSNESQQDKEMEIFELKSYFINQMRELQERNQQLLNENMMLKEIQYELDKSAEKIAVFRSEKKTLSICSYLYDSWKNRESKVDLYKKYIEKVQQYDDLQKKYQQLEAQYLDQLSNKTHRAGTIASQNQPELQKKKRGRKPKNSQLDNSFIEIENENSCEVLTKKVLKSSDLGSKNYLNNLNNLNSKNSNLGKQYLVDDNKSEVSVTILKEKKDYTNKKNITPGNVTPIKSQTNKNNLHNLTNNKTQNKQIVLLESEKSNISQKPILGKKCSSFENNQNKKTNNKQAEDLSRKNSFQINTQTEDQDMDDFDDNRSTFSTITNNGSKKEMRKKKIISKEKKKYNQEAQDIAFNSIADTLFNF